MELNLAELVQALSERQQATERQLSEMDSELKVLQAQVAELRQAEAARPSSADRIQAAASVAQVAVQPKAEVTPDILVVLAAATTAFLGKEVRIRSAKMLQSPYEVINPWAQQGRVFVMASHNLRSRR